MILSGFVGPAYVGQSLNASAEDLINAYLETQESRGASPKQVYYGTPGQTLLLTVPDTPVRATFYQDGRSFAIGGGQFGETTTGAFVFIANVANDGNPATISSNGQAGHQLFLVSGKAGYIYDLNSGVFAQIAAAAFPTGSALMGAYVDGYFLVLTPVQFQLSKLLDGTQWNALDKAQRSIASDNLAAFLPNHRELWLMGTATSEGWYNNGAASFPFAPIAGVFVDQGIAAPWTLTRLDNSVAWLAQNRDGSRQVMQVTQLAPTRISTHAVEASLGACPTVTDFLGFSYQEQGHLFYLLTSAQNNLTWVYDAAEQQWHRRSWRNPVTGLDEAILPRCHAASFGAHWVGDRNSGNIYTQSLGVYTDNGNPIHRLRRAPHLNKEQQRLFYGQFQLDAEMGVGLAAGQGSDPIVYLRWSDTAGKTWSNLYPARLGKQGEYSNRAIWTRLGSGRNRVFEVSTSEPVKQAWVGAYIEVS